MSYGLYLNTVLSCIDSGEFDGLKKVYGVSGVGEYLNLLIHIASCPFELGRLVKGLPYGGARYESWLTSCSYKKPLARCFLNDLCGFGLLSFDDGIFVPHSTMWQLLPADN